MLQDNILQWRCWLFFNESKECCSSWIWGKCRYCVHKKNHLSKHNKCSSKFVSVSQYQVLKVCLPTKSQFLKGISNILNENCTILGFLQTVHRCISWWIKWMMQDMIPISNERHDARCISYMNHIRLTFFVLSLTGSW